MVDRPFDAQDAAAVITDELDVDLSFFPAIWYASAVGHLLESDLDRVCSLYGLSISDINLIGALKMDRSGQARAADLAQALHLSGAALSPRVLKLERRGLLMRMPSTADRRAFDLRLTEKGAEIHAGVIEDISKHARFVRSYRKLCEQDRKELTRLLGDLHKLMA
jgi:DNA-binding MarR family transcriptional regulator